MTRSQRRPAMARTIAARRPPAHTNLEIAPHRPLPPLSHAKVVAAALVLIGSVFLAYIPAMQAGFIRFDDTDYIEENPLLRTTQGLRLIWSRPQAYPPGVQFYPVTFTFHWIEFHLWDGSPNGYHMANISLHAVNALLVWLVLRRLHVPGSLVGALLFAVHPVQVQSVAWLAEGKNMLSAMFYFLTVLAWLRFVRNRSWVMYAVTVIAFLLGLLSKAAICTLPVALLLWIWWRRPPSWKKDVAWTAPLLGLAIVPAALAFWREHSLLEGKAFESGFSPIERLLISGRALWSYLSKLLLPVEIVPIYPHWPVDTHAIWQYAFPVSAATLMVVLWRLRERIGRAPLFAALFYAVGLAPTSGLVDFGYMAKSFVADHYQYIPSLAISAGLAALGATAAARLSGLGRHIALVAAATLLLGLGARTWRQCGVYQNAETFWAYVVAHNPSPTALSSLGDVYLRNKDLIRAEDLLRKALDQRDSANTRFRLGCVLIERRQFAAAAEQFQRGLLLNRSQDRIRGMNPRLLFNLGYSYYYDGRYAEAVDAFRQAIELDPSFANARTWLTAAENSLRQRPAPASPASIPP